MEELKKQQKKKVQKQQLRRFSNQKIYNLIIDVREELGLTISKEDKYTIPVFIPHKGCKNSCVFCNQRQISGEQREVNATDVEKIIEQYLEYYIEKDKKVEVAFFGGSFTGLEVSEQKAFLEVAKKYIDLGLIESIKISTRPDYIDEEILETLNKYGVKTIELGVQSMDDEVLEASKRGHTASHVEIASKLIKSKGFILGHQIMVGLPSSTLEKEVDSIKKCIELNPDIVRIYPVYVLKKSELYEMYMNNQYIPLKLEESIDRVKAIYLECIKNNINVIRVGLQVTEEINSKNEEIIGPVCDNYKERVLSSIMLDLVKEEIDKKINRKGFLGMFKGWNLKDGENINIIVPKEQVNYAVGTLKENQLALEKKYGVNVFVKGI